MKTLTTIAAIAVAIVSALFYKFGPRGEHEETLSILSSVKGLQCPKNFTLYPLLNNGDLILVQVENTDKTRVVRRCDVHSSDKSRMQVKLDYSSHYIKVNTPYIQV